MNTANGLYLDGTDINTPSFALNHAEHIVISDDRTCYEQEAGFIKDYEVDKQLIGEIVTPSCIITFHNEMVGQVRWLRVYKDGVFIVRIVYPVSDKPIFGTYTYNWKKDLFVVFTDGVNDIRYINLNDESNILQPQKEINLIEKTFLAKYLYSGMIDIELLQVGGSLPAGNYSIAVCYELDDYNETPYTPITKTISTINSVGSQAIVTPGGNHQLYTFANGYRSNEITSCAIKVSFENQYKYVSIAVIYFNGISTVVKKIKHVNTGTGSYIITDLTNYIDMNMEEILISKNNYVTCKSMTAVKDKLILGDVVMESEYGEALQAISNNIKMVCNITKIRNENIKIEDTVTFQEGEVYAFYAGFRSKHGGYLSINHIPGDSNTIGISSTHAAILEAVENPNETYAPYFNLAGNVRHHKMPSWLTCNMGSEVDKCTYSLNGGIERSQLESMWKGLQITTPYTYVPPTFGVTKHLKYYRPDLFEHAIINNAAFEFVGQAGVSLKINIKGSISATTGNGIQSLVRIVETLEPSPDFVDISNPASYAIKGELSFSPTNVIQPTGHEVYYIHEFDINFDFIVPTGRISILTTHNGIVGEYDNFKMKISTFDKWAIDTRYNYNISVSPSNVIIPDELKDKIVGIDILCAKRTIGNSRIIDSDVLNPRCWDMATAYGALPAPNDPMYDLLQKDRYLEGHSLSLMQSKMNTNAIKKIEFVGIDFERFLNLTNANKQIIFANPDTNKQSFILEDTYFKTTNYYPNHNINGSNLYGESCIAIYLENVGYSLIKNHFFESWLQGADMQALQAYYFVNYLTGNTDYYKDFVNQELIVLGRWSNVPYYDNIVKGDCSRSMNIVKVTKIQQDKVLPVPLPAATADDEKTLVNMRLHVYFTTSVYKANTLYGGSVEGERTFPSNPLLTVWDQSATLDDFRNTTKGYNPAFNKFTDMYRGVYHKQQNDNINENTTLIAISEVNGSESKTFNWCHFKPNNYKTIPGEAGSIIKLVGQGDRLYIQCEHKLYIAEVKDVLQLGDNTKTYLGTGDIFDRDPREIMSDSLGYIGCISPYHIILIEFGYFVIDANKGCIFHVTDEGVIDISNVNSKNTFVGLLSNVATHSPYTNVGYQLAYDPIKKRLIFAKANIGSLTYDILLKKWVSWHYYNSLRIVNTRDAIVHFVAYNNGYSNGVHKTHQAKIGRYGIFGTSIQTNYEATVKPSILDIVFNTQQPMLLQNVNWSTLVLDPNTNLRHVWEQTIQRLAIYTQDQCTGVNDIVTQLTKSYYNEFNTRLVNERFYYNDIDDMTIDNKLPVVDNVTKAIIDSNINTNTSWYKASKLISRLFYVKMIMLNTNGLLCKIQDVDISAVSDQR